MPNLPKQTFSIQKAAEQVGLHPKTLRRWEQDGRFVAHRTLGGQRRYTVDDIIKLKALKESSSQTGPALDKLITPENAAEKLKVTPTTIQRWTKQGKLTPIKTPAGDHHYSLDQINHLVNTTTPRPSLAPTNSRVADATRQESLAGFTRRMPGQPKHSTPEWNQNNLAYKWLQNSKAQKALVYALATSLILSTGVAAYSLFNRPDQIASPSVQELDISPEVEIALPNTASFLNGEITIGTDTGTKSFLDQNGNLYIKNNALIQGSINAGSLQLFPSQEPESQIGRQYVDADTGNLMYFDGSDWLTLNQIGSTATGSGSTTLTFQDLYDTGNSSITASNQDINITLGSDDSVSSDTDFVIRLKDPENNFSILGAASQEMITVKDQATYPITIGQVTKIVGNLHAPAIYDTANSDYYLDLDSSTDSLKMAGDLTLDEKITFSKNSETIDNDTDGYFTISGGLYVNGESNYGIDTDGDLIMDVGQFKGALTADSTFEAKGQVTLGDDEDTIAISGTTVAITSNTSGNDITLKSADQIILQPSADTDDYLYLTTTSNVPEIYFEGFTSNDPGFRINSSSNQLEYRDQNESTWTALDSSTSTPFTDGGTYLYPTGYESIRIYDATATDYLDLAHDGTDLNATFATTTLFNLDASAFVLEVSSDNIGLGTTDPDAPLHTIGDAYFAADSGYTFDNPSADTDVYIKGNLEVDGTFYGSISGTIDGSGTASLIPKWSDSDTLTDSIIFDDATNIGIGTTDPNYKLDVAGSLRSTSTITFSGLGATADNTVLVIDGNNNLNTDEIDPDVWTAGTLIDGNGTASYLPYYSDADTLAITNTFYDGTNIGIGTTDPTRLLDVLGDMRLDGQLYDENNAVGTPGQVLSTTATGVDWIDASGTIDGSGTASYVTKWTDSDTLTSSVIYDDATNIGLGTTTPGYKLDITGSLRSTSTITFTGLGTTTDNSVLVIDSNNNLNTDEIDPDVWTPGTLLDGNGTANYLPYYSDADTLAISNVYYDATNIGIGTTAPGYMLDIVGSLRSTSTITFSGLGTTTDNSV